MQPVKIYGLAYKMRKMDIVLPEVNKPKWSGINYSINSQFGQIYNIYIKQLCQSLFTVIVVK